jgi:hypothetical protein
MTLAYLPVLAIAMLFGGVIFSAWKAARRGESEEKAHASAWRRRKLMGQAARRCREGASMTILGDAEKSPAECRVTHVSRSSLRALSNSPFGEGSQVQVEWGEDVFVGNVVTLMACEEGHNMEIALLSSTYSSRGFLTKLVDRLQS